MNSVLFCVQEKSKLKEIPLICTLTLQGRYPAFLHPED